MTIVPGSLAMSRIASLLRRWAARLVHLADRLDPPAPPAPVAADEQTRRAQRFCDELVLRRALHDTLRRYSPREEPGQA